MSIVGVDDNDQDCLSEFEDEGEIDDQEEVTSSEDGEIDSDTAAPSDASDGDAFDKDGSALSPIGRSAMQSSTPIVSASSSSPSTPLTPGSVHVEDSKCLSAMPSTSSHSAMQPKFPLLSQSAISDALLSTSPPKSHIDPITASSPEYTLTSQSSSDDTLTASPPKSVSTSQSPAVDPPKSPNNPLTVSPPKSPSTSRSHPSSQNFKKSKISRISSISKTIAPLSIRTPSPHPLPSPSTYDDCIQSDILPSPSSNEQSLVEQSPRPHDASSNDLETQADQPLPSTCDDLTEQSPRALDASSNDLDQQPPRLPTTPSIDALPTSTHLSDATSQSDSDLSEDELLLYSVKLDQQIPVEPPRTYHLNADMSVRFVARRYRIVFMLDISPSIASVVSTL